MTALLTTDPNEIPPSLEDYLRGVDRTLGRVQTKLKEAASPLSTQPHLANAVASAKDCYT